VSSRVPHAQISLQSPLPLTPFLLHPRLPP
jgi:hypothetical protein